AFRRSSAHCANVIRRDAQRHPAATVGRCRGATAGCVTDHPTAPRRWRDRARSARAMPHGTKGVHLLCEFSGCDPDILTNLEAIKSALEDAARRANVTI